VDLTPLLETGAVVCDDVALTSAKHGSITCNVRWWPHDTGDARGWQSLGRTPSKRQREEQDDDRLIRRFMRLEAAMCLFLLAAASLDLALHKEAGGGADSFVGMLRAFFEDLLAVPGRILAVWLELCTLTAAPHLRQLLWFYSIYAVACAAPLVIFSLPTVGNLLLQNEPTGYDKAGNLRNNLKGGARRAKFHEDYAAVYPPAGERAGNGSSTPAKSWSKRLSQRASAVRRPSLAAKLPSLKLGSSSQKGAQLV